MWIKSGLRVNSHARAAREFLSRTKLIVDSPFDSIVKNLHGLNVSHVIDVGANVGQFGIDLRRHGFIGQIISYEPVQETFKSLVQTTIRHQPWTAIRLGLGSSESESIINVSGNDGLSSSLLEMGKLHLENFPTSKTVERQPIAISTIDNQLDALRLHPQEVMLKLDVQGYEAEVLRGGAKSLSRIPLCFLELSLIPLYEGEVPFLPILNELFKNGHEVIDVYRGITAKDGSLLQLDILTRLSNH